MKKLTESLEAILIMGCAKEVAACGNSKTIRKTIFNTHEAFMRPGFKDKPGFSTIFKAMELSSQILQMLLAKSLSKRHYLLGNKLL